jgi:hypothetical protein
VPDAAGRLTREGVGPTTFLATSLNAVYLLLRCRSRPCGSEIDEEKPDAIIVLGFGKPNTLGGTVEAFTGTAVHCNFLGRGQSQNQKAPGVGRQPGGFLRANAKSLFAKPLYGDMGYKTLKAVATYTLGARWHPWPTLMLMRSAWLRPASVESWR